MSNTSKSLFSFLLGAATGVVIGMLYAPDKGTQTRGKLSYLLDKYKNHLEDLVQELVKAKSIPESEARSEGQKVIKNAKEKAEKLLEDVDDLIGQIKNKNN
jgi:gas vesicle protein